MQIVNKNYEHEKVDRGTYNGYKNTRKFTTNYGYSIECSNNHPLMVLKRNGEIDFVLARNLRVGDKILISTQNDIWSKKSQFFEIDQYGIRKRWALHLPEHLTPDLAYVIGCLVGAGKVSTRSRVTLVTGSEDTVIRYKHILNRRNIKINDHTKKGVKYKYINYGQGYGDYLKQIDMLNCTKDAQTRHFPDYIMTASKECAVAALRGFFDARVEVNPNDNKLTLESQSYELIKQLRLLLLNCGVITKFETRVRRRNGEKDSYLLTISNQALEVFRKNVGFYDPKKREILTKMIHKLKRKGIFYDDRYKDNYFVDTIKTVELSKAHVYDISVPDTHSFVSNGFISHNTWGEVISMFIIAILYPGITMSLTAQTKANAAELLKDKYDEITRQFPLIKNEMFKPRVAKDDFEVNFVNGSRIDVLANAQQSKGQRRNRIQIEESALLDNDTFEDALKPIVEIGRTTRGKLGITDPQELNQSISFYTTAGFRGSDEWARSVNMYKDMLDLKGDLVLGSGWMLGCWMGRGSNKGQILKKKKDTGAVSFARNYEENWVGATDNQLVDIKKLLKTRTLTEPVLDNADNSREIVLGVDVARSANDANNKTAISVVEEHHAQNGLITELDLINMFLVSNQLNFGAQACLVKRIQEQYHAKMVVVDTNGLGSGLRDELLRPNTDMETGEVYPAWDAVNGEIKSEYREAEPILYALNSQAKDDTKKDGRINSYAIINFIDCVEGHKLRLLEEKRDNGTNLADEDSVKAFVPFAQTNALVEEISNLKLKHLTNGEVTVEKVLKKIDKDRFSSLIYALWWAMSYDNELVVDNKDLVMTIAKMNSNGTRKGSSLSRLFR